MSTEKQDGIQIKNSEITNFRGVERCKVDDLSLVNFFVGENNSGKSTLLDAIYLGCKEPISQSLPTVLRDRVQRTVGVSEIFFGYDKDSKATIAIDFNTGYKYSLSFFVAKERTKGGGIDVQERQLASCITTAEGEWYLTAYAEDLGSVWGGTSTPSFLKGEIKGYCKGAMLFHSTFRKIELTNKLDGLLGTIKLRSKIENELNKMMTDVYGEFEYEFIPRPEDYGDRRVALKQGSYRVFSDFRGDGEQRALSILSTLKLSSDIPIFIEEIETFQHPKALRKLAKHIVELAKQKRIQLFISTHSYFDALRYFYYAFEEKEREELFRCYVVTRDNGVVDVKLENNIQNIIDELYKEKS